MRYPRWLGVGIVGVAFIGGTASAVQQGDKEVDEAFIQKSFAGWLEKDADATAQRTNPVLSSVTFAASDLKLDAGDKLRLEAQASSSANVPEAERALRGLVLDFLRRQFNQDLQGLGKEQAERDDLLAALEKGLVVQVASEKDEAESPRANSSGIDQRFIQGAFASWLDRDPEARDQLASRGLASVKVTASDLNLIEPDKLTLTVHAPFSANVSDAERELKGLVVRFLKRQFDQDLQKRGVERAERDRLLAALENNLIVHVEPEKADVGPDAKEVVEVPSPQASPQILRYASPQALSKACPPAFPSALDKSHSQRVAARPVFGAPSLASLTPEARYSNGLNRYWAGHYAEAREDFSAAVAGDEKNPSAWYFKGLSELALGDQLAAEASVARGAAIQAANDAVSREVGLSLVRVQGPARMWIERALAQARSNKALARATGPN